LVNSITPDLEDGGYLIDWHACDCFPEDLVDLVIVIRADTEILYDRLKARNYSEAKLQQNMDAEIFQELLEEARRAFPDEMVQEMHSNNLEQMDGNVARIAQWVDVWKQNNT
jgi:adenylate kinase